VDLAGCPANHGYIIDFIQFRSISKHLNHADLSRFYVGEGLSTQQIATKLGCSKSLVVTTLKRMKLLRGMAGSLTNPKNYLGIPPYGYRVVAGRLEPLATELKVCRLIVRLIDQDGLTFRKVGEKLEKLKIKNRMKKVAWHHCSVAKIYHRWKGKA
jgi:hypothetical protein